MDMSHFRIWMLKPGEWWWTHITTGAWHGDARGPFKTFLVAGDNAADAYDLVPRKSICISEVAKSMGLVVVDIPLKNT